MSSSPDPAFAALLADRRVALRPPSERVPLELLRAAANQFQASAVAPAVFGTADFAIKGPDGPLALRLYRPSARADLPVILYCHGGGFVLGNLDTHAFICATLANRASATVVAVDYRLAPEHPFPAALDDCVAALEWLVANGQTLALDTRRIGLAGDSAGGQLAIAAALAHRADDRLRCLGLLYPLIDPAQASVSAGIFGEGYMLTRSFLDWAWAAYGGDGPLSPLFDLTRADLTGLPPATVMTAEFDPLRDEGEDFARRLRAAGGAVVQRRYAGMIHGFAGLPQLTSVAEQAIALLADEMRGALLS